MPSASDVMVAQVGSPATNAERFAHVPVDRPTLIDIVHPDLPEAATLATAVGDELRALGPIYPVVMQWIVEEIGKPW